MAIEGIMNVYIYTDEIEGKVIPDMWMWKVIPDIYLNKDWWCVKKRN